MSRVMLVALLLPPSASPSCVEPACVRIGGLFPIFKTAAADYAIDASGVKRFSSFYLAIQEINNKTDGVADDLLPNTTLQFALRDSKRDDSSAFFGALELTQDTFGGEGVKAIVGAASSGPSKAAALVTARARVPQVSYSSTSSDLSSGVNYPFFLRTPPSDAFQAEGIADVIKNYFGFTTVATAASTDGYGAAGIANFLSAADSLGLTVLTSQNFAKDSTDFSDQYRELSKSGARVIVLFCQASDAGNFMKGAYEQGIGGEGYLWFGSDAVTKSDTWLNNDVLLDEALRLQVMQGYFGLTPTTGKGSAAYEAYMARLRAMPATTGNSTSCNLELDDDGGSYLWAQDHDNNASTPLECAGNDNQEEGSYAPYSYDATYAIAYALHELIEVRGVTTVTGDDLLEALLSSVSFAGVTGTIEFNDACADAASAACANLDFHGDRQVGINYEVLNYQSVAAGLVQVASWTPGAAAWADRWAMVEGQGVVYSTADNSMPRDVLPPECDASHYNHTVSECDVASQKRPVTFGWVQPKACEGGVALPENFDQPCDHVPLGSPTAAAVIAGAALGAGLCLAVLLWLLLAQAGALGAMAATLARFAQPALSAAFVGGAFLLSLATVALLGPNTDSTCMLRPWLFNLSFSLMFAALFQKVYKVYRIFNNASLANLKLRWHKLLLQTLGLVAIDAFILLLWSVLFPPRAVLVRETVVTIEMESVVCRSEPAGTNLTALAEAGGAAEEQQLPLFSVLTILFKGVLIAYGCYMSFKTRNSDLRFLESMHIMLAIFTVAVVAAVVLPVSFMIDETPARVAMQGLGTSLCCLASVSFVFGPKMCRCASRRVLHAVAEAGSTQVGSTQVGSTMAGQPSSTLAIDANEELAAENADLKERLERMRDELDTLQRGSSGKLSRVEP